MGIITITFPNPLNVSIQEGDTAYYTNDVNGKNIQVIGEITSVSGSTIMVEEQPTLATVSEGILTLDSFILFSKTSLVNSSGLKGYYAEMQFKNDAVDYAELFLVGSEIFESSK
jgi:hypothetical protein|tara:strand:- start:5879 stop:6220 length:342 start_codon:yes stop_codon:yes gene_type:complete